MASRVMVLLAVCAVACSSPHALTPHGTSPSADGLAGTSKPARTEEEVRKDLAGEGYSEVHELKPQSDGSWTAIAVLDGKEKPLMITPNGFIFPR